MDNIYVGGVFEEINTGNRHLLLIKYDNLGNYQSNITWGSNYYHNDGCYGLALDSADNIYLTGQYSEDDFDLDFNLLKYNKLGEYQWNRTWGENGEDYGNRMVLDSLDNIYITGQYGLDSGETDICLLKYNDLGEYQWNRTWDRSNHEYGWGIALDSSDNIYITGLTLTDSFPNYDTVVIKYNNTGTILWNETWGKDHLDAIVDIAVDTEDNIYLAGFANYSATRQFDFWLMQYDINGQQLYNNTWGGSKNDQYWAITIDSANNLFLVRATENFGSNKYDVYLAKYSFDETSSNGQPSDNVIPFGSFYLIFTLFGIAFLIAVELKRKKLLK